MYRMSWVSDFLRIYIHQHGCTTTVQCLFGYFYRAIYHEDFLITAGFGVNAVTTSVESSATFFFLFTPRSIHCFFVCLFLSPADGVSHFNRRLWQMREQPGAVRSICHVPNTHSFRRVDYICKLTPLLTVTQRLGFLEIFCYHFLVAATWGSLLFQARVSIGWILNPWAANPGYRSHHRLWCLQKKTEPQLWLLLQKPY